MPSEQIPNSTKRRRQATTAAMVVCGLVILVVAARFAMAKLSSAESDFDGAGATESTAEQVVAPATASAMAARSSPMPGLEIAGREMSSSFVLGDQLLVIDETGEAVLVTPATGQVIAIASPPIVGGWWAADAWTGEELLLWSLADRAGITHSNVGVAYNPSTGSWRSLPTAPIEGRSPEATAFVDGEFYVWGGRTFDDETTGDDVGPGVRELSDSAAYDPASDTWRIVGSERPSSVVGPFQQATNEVTFLWLDGMGSVGVAEFDSSGDTWLLRPVEASAMFERQSNPQTVVVLNGTSVVVMSVQLPVGQAPATIQTHRLLADGSWEQVEEPPLDTQTVICLNRLLRIEGFVVAIRCDSAAVLVADKWVPLSDVPGQYLFQLTDTVIDVDAAQWIYGIEPAS